MITNSNRSGSIRDESGKDRREKPEDDVRSGRSSDGPAAAEETRLKLRRQKIIDVAGERKLVDA
jgi:hypothetical protein